MRFWIFFLLLFSSPSFSAFEDLTIGARATAMGGAYVALADDAYGFYFNPAGLSEVSGLEISSFYTQLYNLKELPYASLSLVSPTRFGNLGLGFSSFGYDLYKEEILIFSYGRPLHPKVSFGFNLKGMRLKILGYGSSVTLGLDVGLMGYLTDRLGLGFSSRNINNPQIGRCREGLPQSYAFGLRGCPIPKLILTCDFYSDLRYPLEIRVGEEYQLFPLLALRAGVGRNPNTFNFGAGFSTQIFTLDYAVRTHSTLGLTHQISLSLSIGGRKEKETKEEVLAETTNTSSLKKMELPPRLEINRASIEEFDLLPGIGIKTAEAIVQYRMDHGPFKRVEEIQEVPGLGIKTFERIKDFIYVEGDFKAEGKPVRINLNTATLEELASLPGIGEKIAQRILEYREKRGSFKNLEEIMEVSGVGRKTFEEIKDYLILGE